MPYTNKKMKKLIIGLGEVLWDVLPEGKKLGGAPANFAYFTQQFGNDAIAVSAIGNDDLGGETIEALNSNGLKFITPRVNFPTGSVSVKLDAQGVPTYTINQGVAWDNIPFTDEMEKAAGKCDAVCWGTLAQRSETSRNSINKFINFTSDECLRIFDINLRGNFYTKDIIKESLNKCKVLKINDEEFPIVTELFGYGKPAYQDGCQHFMKDFYIETIILTCGATGSYAFTANGECSYIETPKVKVADTVGAGDSFTGTFCSAILANLPIKEAHRLAVEVSAYVCTQNGAMPKLPEDFIARISH